MFWHFLYRLYLFITRPFTVSNILKSSHELDRMRKEIQELPPILIMVLEKCVGGRQNHRVFEEFQTDLNRNSGKSDEYYVWYLNIESNTPVGVRLVSKDGVSLFTYNIGKQFQLEYSRVGMVHSRLQDLVDLLIKRIPDFEYQLNHFVKAHKNT